MDALARYLSIIKDNSAAISAVTALVAVIVGPLVSYLIARKSIYSNIVISNRIKRLEAVRDELAQFCALYNRNIFCIEKLHGSKTEELRKQLNAELDELGTDLSLLRISLSFKVDFRSDNQRRLQDMIDRTAADLNRFTAMPDHVIDIGTFAREVGKLMWAILQEENNRIQRLK